jgi:2-polyprenyl-3-methyl-5-hydroxy-6-metoxy-1,4-benzoquinol methylase
MMNQEKEIILRNLQELRNSERLHTCGPESAERYRKIHSYRFDRTVQFCKEWAPDPNARVLDVGSSQLTILLKQYYKNVITLGFDLAADDGGQQAKELLSLSQSHRTYDLNNAENFESWPDRNEKFDLIVFSETVEHLKTAPEYSLALLRSLLTEKGIILLTTPNAATIMKRLILLLKGKNPYERIRMFSENPGHYREYTMKEVVDIGDRSGLKTICKKSINLYQAASFTQAFLKRLRPSFRDTLVVVFQKRDVLQKF